VGRVTGKLAASYRKIFLGVRYPRQNPRQNHVPAAARRALRGGRPAEEPGSFDAKKPSQPPARALQCGRMNRLYAWLLPVVCLAQSTPPEPEDIGARFSTTVVESLFGTNVVDPSRLRGDIYYLKPGTAALPNFKKLKPVGSIYTNGFNIPRRAFDEGFPGVTDRFEWFAIDYSGKFYIAAPGKYDFALFSDDGSMLYIDGKKVVRNDGLHPTRRADGSATLSQGVHSLRLSYFQGPREWVALLLGIRKPGEKGWRIFNTDEFKIPPDVAARAAAGAASTSSQ
jgi:hypothetical protein